MYEYNLKIGDWVKRSTYPEVRGIIVDFPKKGMGEFIDNKYSVFIISGYNKYKPGYGYWSFEELEPLDKYQRISFLNKLRFLFKKDFKMPDVLNLLK